MRRGLLSFAVLTTLEAAKRCSSNFTLSFLGSINFLDSDQSSSFVSASINDSLMVGAQEFCSASISTIKSGLSSTYRIAMAGVMEPPPQEFVIIVWRRLHYLDGWRTLHR